MSLKNVKISKKILTLIAVATVFLLAVGFTGYKYLNQMAENASNMYRNALLPVKYSNEERTHLRAVKADTFDLMLATSKEDQQRLQEDIKERAALFDKALALYEQAQLDPVEKEKLAKIKEIMPDYRASRTKAAELALAGKQAEGYQYYIKNAKEPLETLTQLFTELADYNAEKADRLDKENQAATSLAVIIMLATTIIAIVLCVIFGLLISRMITSPVKNMQVLMVKAEDGDFTIHSDYQSKDEVGQLGASFNEMIKGLKVLIQQVSESAANLAASTQQISASTEEIASGSQQQSVSAQTATEMVTQMSDAVQEVAKNAEEAAHASEKAVEMANKGGAVIRETLSGMEEISEKIDDLASESAQIGNIIEVIDEIAEQTNLLALNAAIEAARAGEAGKGFAVVADEVRKLAERSGKATKEIAELIQSIQKNTEDAVDAVKAGNQQTQKAGETFTSMIDLVRDSSVRVSEIAAASEEQAAQSGEVMNAVSSIAAVTEETSAGAQETASTANELARMAETLSNLTAKFKLS